MWVMKWVIAAVVLLYGMVLFTVVHIADRTPPAQAQSGPMRLLWKSPPDDQFQIEMYCDRFGNELVIARNNTQAAQKIVMTALPGRCY